MAGDKAITPPLDKETGSVVDDQSTPYYGDLFDDYLDVSGNAFRPAEARQVKFMLRSDGKIRKLENALSLPIRSCDWRIDPPDDGGSDDATKFVEDTLRKPANNGGMSTPMGLIIGQMTSAMLYRTAMFEKVFTDRDGRIVYDKVGFRQATNTRILRDKTSGAFKGLEQPPAEGQTRPRVIPAARSFAYIHGAHREPLTGVSEFDVAWLVFTTKQKIRYLWYQWFGKQVVPKTAVTEQAGTSGTAGAGTGGPSDAAKRGAKGLAGLAMGASVALAPGLTPVTLDTAGNAGDAWTAALAYLDAEIADSMLAGFTDLASAAASGAGSYALSRDQHDFFLMGMTAVANDMAEHINNYLIADLVRWNFGPTVAPPRFVFEDLAGPPADQLVALLTTFGQGAPIPNEFIMELVDRTADMLGMDTDKIAKAFEKSAAAAEAKAKSEAAFNAAPLTGAVDAAAGLTAAATGAPAPGSGAADDPATVLAAAGAA